MRSGHSAPPRIRGDMRELSLGAVGSEKHDKARRAGSLETERNGENASTPRPRGWTAPQEEAKPGMRTRRTPGCSARTFSA